MANPFDEFQTALTQARIVNRAADENAEAMAKLLVGRLRCIKGHFGVQDLVRLKRELRDFNVTTKRWKK